MIRNVANGEALATNFIKDKGFLLKDNVVFWYFINFFISLHEPQLIIQNV